MKTFWIALALSVACPLVWAGELDPGPASAPKGLIVRVAPEGKHEVYRAVDASRVSSDDVAEQEARRFVSEANRINSIRQGGELDEDTSKGAWCYWLLPLAFLANAFYQYNVYNYSQPYYQPFYYTYAYNNYNWTYYPYYAWQTPRYTYYYYWW